MKILLAALAAFSLGTAASATTNPFAQDKALLQLNGLDLSTAQGQQRLAIRMDQAARAVCGDRMSTVHVALGEQERSCRAEVVADIRNQIEARSAALAHTSSVQVASR